MREILAFVLGIVVARLTMLVITRRRHAEVKSGEIITMAGITLILCMGILIAGLLNLW